MPKANKNAGKSAQSASEAIHTVATHRRARFEYELMDRVEAGMVLTGTEVKALRQAKANLEGAYASIENGEAWLHDCDIPEYSQGNQLNHKPKRSRKLLLHRREIERLNTRAGQKGLTLIPTRIYFKKGIAKVEIAIARGKKLHDKRESLKTREAKREIDRASASRRRMSD
jgi:SsrA-binding protein